MPEKSVLVIGGSGFLGHHIVNEAIEQGFHTTVLTRAKALPDTLPVDAGLISADMYQLQPHDYTDILKGFDKVVFAAGIDERCAPKGDAYEFYANANIEPCRRIFTAMQDSDATHAVVLNSVFATMEREHPEMKLAEYHPYIKSRVDQSEVCHELAEGHFIMTVLEVPWVFGKPAKPPSQWQSLVDYARGSIPLMACRGGCNIISARSLAEATVNALSLPEKSSNLPIGDLNITYEDLLKQICKYAGRTDDSITLINDDLFLELMKTGGVFKELFQIESGLDTRHIGDLLLSELFFDNTESVNELQYTTGIALDALNDTIASCDESIVMKNWRKTINLFDEKLSGFRK
jgi:nucleoside-diphosphate-sugar epimerase